MSILSKTKAAIRYVWRSAITGRFISKAKADKSRQTTYRDTIKRVSEKPCKGGQS